MASMHRLLRFALEQDPGRAETPREGLILFIVRLAIRVESYGRLVVEQRHRVGKRQVDAKQQSLEGMLGRVGKNKQQIFYIFQVAKQSREDCHNCQNLANVLTWATGP